MAARRGFLLGGATSLLVQTWAVIGQFVPQLSDVFGGRGYVLLLLAVLWATHGATMHVAMLDGGRMPRRSTIVAMTLVAAGWASVLAWGTPPVPVFALAGIGLAAMAYAPYAVQSAERRRTVADPSRGSVDALNAGIAFGQTVVTTVIGLGLGLLAPWAGLPWAWRVLVALLLVLAIIWMLTGVPAYEPRGSDDPDDDHVDRVRRRQETKWAGYGMAWMGAAYAAVYGSLTVVVYDRWGAGHAAVVVAVLTAVRGAGAPFPTLFRNRIERSRVTVAKQMSAGAAAAGAAMGVFALLRGWFVAIGLGAAIVVFEACLLIARVACKSRWDSQSGQAVLALAAKRAEAYGAAGGTVAVLAWLESCARLARALHDPVVLGIGLDDLGRAGAWLLAVPGFVLLGKRYSLRAHLVPGEVIHATGRIRITVLDGRPEVLLVRAFGGDGEGTIVRSCSVPWPGFVYVGYPDGTSMAEGRALDRTVTVAAQSMHEPRWLKRRRRVHLHDARGRSALVLVWQRRAGASATPTRTSLTTRDWHVLRDAGIEARVRDSATMWTITGVPVEEPYEIVTHVPPQPVPAPRPAASGTRPADPPWHLPHHARRWRSGRPTGRHRARATTF